MVRDLQNELVYRGIWPTLAQLRTATFDYIEIFYNRQRRHSALGHLSPARYEINQQLASEELLRFLVPLDRRASDQVPLSTSPPGQESLPEHVPKPKT